MKSEEELKIENINTAEKASLALMLVMCMPLLNTIGYVPSVAMKELMIYE